MKNKIKSSLENIEASEAAKQRIYKKISDYANKPAKSAPAFMKWLPLTAAACVLIAVSVLIMPMVLTGEYIPPEGNGTELFPIDTVVPLADLSPLAALGYTIDTDGTLYVSWGEQSISSDSFDEAFAGMWISGDGQTQTIDSLTENLRSGFFYRYEREYNAKDGWHGQDAVLRSFTDYDFTGSQGNIHLFWILDSAPDIMYTITIDSSQAHENWHNTYALGNIFDEGFHISYFTKAIAPHDFITHENTHNFVILENTFDFDVNLISLQGDNMHFYATLEFVPRDGAEFYDETLHADFTVSADIRFAGDKPFDNWQGGLQNWWYSDGTYYFEVFFHSVYQNILGEDFYIDILRYGMNFEGEHFSGRFSASFTAEFELGDVAAFDFTDSPMITFQERRCILRYALFSNSSFTLVLDFYDPGHPDKIPDGVVIDFSDKIEARFADGEVITLFEFGVKSPYVRNSFEDVIDFTEGTQEALAEIVKGYTLVKGFDISEIVSIIISGHEFELHR